MSGKKHFVSLKFESRSGVQTRDLRLSKQAALTTAPAPRPGAQRTKYYVRNTFTTEPPARRPGPVFSYKLRYIVTCTIYRNLYENTGPDKARLTSQAHSTNLGIKGYRICHCEKWRYDPLKPRWRHLVHLFLQNDCFSYLGLVWIITLTHFLYPPPPPPSQQARTLMCFSVIKWRARNPEQSTVRCPCPSSA